MLQNGIKNDVFLVLCWKKCIPTNAPGQPPNSPRRCNVHSLTRHSRFRACILSYPYVRNATPLTKHVYVAGRSEDLSMGLTE